MVGYLRISCKLVSKTPVPMQNTLIFFLSYFCKILKQKANLQVEMAIFLTNDKFVQALTPLHKESIAF